MKVLVNYEPSNGTVTFPDGIVCTTDQRGLSYPEHKESGGTNIDALKELKQAGFTANEIIQMKEAGLL